MAGRGRCRGRCRGDCRAALARERRRPGPARSSRAELRLAAALRWTTASVSVAAGGPVLYAILSPVKAGVALAAAALLVDRDAQALDAAMGLGLAVCAAAAATFVAYGRRRTPVSAP